MLLPRLFAVYVAFSVLADAPAQLVDPRPLDVRTEVVFRLVLPGQEQFVDCCLLPCSAGRARRSCQRQKMCCGTAGL